MSDYQAPTIEVLGTVTDLTRQVFSKPGDTPDIYSETVPVVGSLTPVP